MSDDVQVVVGVLNLDLLVKAGARHNPPCVRYAHPVGAEFPRRRVGERVFALPNSFVVPPEAESSRTAPEVAT